jgi:hypothetical protein
MDLKPSPSIRNSIRRGFIFLAHTSALLADLFLVPSQQHLPIITAFWLKSTYWQASIAAFYSVSCPPSAREVDGSPMPASARSLLNAARDTQEKKAYDNHSHVSPHAVGCSNSITNPIFVELGQKIPAAQ